MLMYIQELQIGRTQSTLEITSQHLGINGHWREYNSSTLFCPSCSRSPLPTALIYNSCWATHTASRGPVPWAALLSCAQGWHPLYSRIHEPRFPVQVWWGSWAKSWVRQNIFRQVCYPSAFWINVMFTPTWRIFWDEYNLIISILIITAISLFLRVDTGTCWVVHPLPLQFRSWDRAQHTLLARDPTDSSVTLDRPLFSDTLQEGPCHTLWATRSGQGSMREGFLSLICQDSSGNPAWESWPRCFCSVITKK